MNKLEKFLDGLNILEVYRYYQKCVEGKNQEKADFIWEYMVYNYPNYFKGGN